MRVEPRYLADLRGVSARGRGSQRQAISRRTRRRTTGVSSVAGPLASGELDPELPRVFDQAWAHGLAEVRSNPVFRAASRRAARPGPGARSLSPRSPGRAVDSRCEQVVERARRRVPLGEPSPRPHFFRRVVISEVWPVLVVEHGALRDPRGTRIAGNAVAGSIEREPEARRRAPTGRAEGPRRATRGRRCRPARPSRSAARCSRRSSPAPMSSSGRHRRSAARKASPASTDDGGPACRRWPRGRRSVRRPDGSRRGR